MEGFLKPFLPGPLWLQVVVPVRFPMYGLAQLAGAVEYTDCISAEE